MKQILTTVLWLAGYSAAAFTGKYSGYYDLINAAEKKFVEKQPGRSVSLYKNAFNRFPAPFVSDCYIAAEIAWVSGDTSSFLQFLGTGFKNGMPLTALGAAPVLRSITESSAIYSRIKEVYDYNRKYYHENTPDIDTLLLRSYTCDSLKVALGNTRNKAEMAAIATAFNNAEERLRRYVGFRYISRGIFPSEKIMGIMTDERYADFRKRYNKPDLFPREDMDALFAQKGMNVQIVNASREEYELSCSVPFNAFIHSTCAIQEYGQDLWQCVLNGYLHPKDYGVLVETAYAWNRSGTVAQYAHVCPPDTGSYWFNLIRERSVNGRSTTFVTGYELVKKVEENRLRHHMQHFAIDERKREIEKEKGMKFFFGFMETR